MCVISSTLCLLYSRSPRYSPDKRLAGSLSAMFVTAKRELPAPCRYQTDRGRHTGTKTSRSGSRCFPIICVVGTPKTSGYVPRFKPRTYVSGQHGPVREVCRHVTWLGPQSRPVPALCLIVLVQPRVSLPQQRVHRLQDGKERGVSIYWTDS
jgi:hypothetical protein